MSINLNQRCNLLQLELAKMFPSRVVSRDAHLVNDPDRDDLSAGIYSIVSLRGNNYRSSLHDSVDAGSHYLMIIARVSLGNTAKGADVEKAELEIVDEIKSFLRRNDLPEPLTGAELIGFNQSGQQEVPNGFVIFELKFLCA